MNRRAGFTIVELIIVIVIMAILLMLAVVNLDNSQVSARDDERTTDIANLARGLESFYTSGSDSSTVTGQYPTTALISDPTVLRDVDPRSYRTPDTDDSGSSLVAATNTTETAAGVTPQPTISQYVYQPIATDGTLCTTTTQECRRFNLYYRLEADNTVYRVTSQHQ